MKILLVPVIMGCALGGTVAMIKVIHHFFPEMDRLTKPFGEQDSQPGADAKE